MSNAEPSSRLLQIDALRGVAALAVVLFHYTTRFAELYRPSTATAFSVPWGFYGVNLFFIISGFVIFMTLDRARRPMDFVVSRFSRLYPTYWAAIALTFAVVHLLGLPGKEVDLLTAVKNLSMLQGLFGVPAVDSVYWTLEIELLFYAGMLLLFWLKRLAMVHRLALGLLAVRWLDFFGAPLLGIHLPWTLGHLLILPYLPWFALGLAIYTLSDLVAVPQPQQRDAKVSAAVALLTLAVTESLALGALGVGLAAPLFLAARGGLPVLRQAGVVWLGSISYPLYLLHENIGWSLMLAALRQGLDLNAAAGLTLLAVLLLAHGVSRAIEMPAMRRIRQAYRHRAAAVQQPKEA